MKTDNSKQAILARSHRHRQLSVSCRTPGCPGVVALGKFGHCNRCATRMGIYGSYTGRKLPRIFYATQYAEAKKFVHQFASHPNIQASRAFLLSWLRKAQLGQPVPGQKAVAGLADRDNPESIASAALVELLSLDWYSRMHVGNPMLTPFMYANAFLRCYKGLPRGKERRGKRSPVKHYYISRLDRAAIAKEISRFFHPLFFEAAAWRDREEKLRNAQLAAGNTSFPNLCQRCAYNERKRLERQRVRDGGKGRLTKSGKIDGRTREGLLAAGRHINPKLKIKEATVGEAAHQEKEG